MPNPRPRSLSAPSLLLTLLLAGFPGGMWAAEVPLRAWLEVGASGNLHLVAPSDQGRAYQVEWAAALSATPVLSWQPVLAAPVQGTGGELAFYLGQIPSGGGAEPTIKPRRDFIMLAYADGTSLAQWRAADGTTILRRRVALDFRRVPNVASAQTADALVVTQSVRSEADGAPPVGVEDTDPSIVAALNDLEAAYLALRVAQLPPARIEAAAMGALFGTEARFWRVRRLELDGDADELSDFREWQETRTNPLASDTDGDGGTDGAEVTAGTSPVDFFNAVRPSLTILPSRFGDVPFANTDEWLADPVVVEIRSASGVALPFAPVSVAVPTGGLALASDPLVTRTAQPFLQTLADAQGRVRLAVKLAGPPAAATILRVWAGQGMGFQSLHTVVYTARPYAADATILAWLRPEEGVTVDAGGSLVSEWADKARSVTGTATTTLRPTLDVTGVMPFVVFGGAQRLDLGSARGGATMTAIFLAQPITTRTEPALDSADEANRVAGFAGQRYVLASTVPNSATPWKYTAPIARRLQTTQHFSRYTAKYIARDTVFNYRSYSCREITYASGYLPSNLPAAQVPVVRYDITPSAVAGPPQVGTGNIYRLNPALANCPLKAGATIAQCLADFITRRGLPANYEWDTAALGSYTRRAGNPVVDDFTETYYEAAGYLPAVPEKYELQPGSIGAVGQGISLGTNSAGYFHLSASYAPALGTRPTPPANPAVPHLTSVVLTNGRPAWFSNGKTAGSSIAPAGGTPDGFRTLGGVNTSSNGFNGKLGDVLLTSTAATDAARQNLEDRIAERYRLTTVDRDADALPDWWERRFFTTGLAAAASGNTDADGSTNAQEFATRSLPETADTDSDNLNDGTETVTSPLNPDSDGDGFLDGADPLPTDPANGRADLEGDGMPEGLAALLAAPGQRDTDGDGLSDFSELVSSHTNARAADTDGDGLPDAWEVTNHLDPNDPTGDNGPTGDPDHDLRLNAAEFSAGKDPRLAD